MQQSYQPRLTFKDKFNMVAGVILPAIAITVEASTQLCASAFFDPIPTAWHLVMVILVPLAQLYVWFTIRRGTPDRLMLAGFVNAFALGVSLYFSIFYLPFLPLGILLVVIVVGVLLLSPFLSLIAAISMRQQLRQLAATRPPRNFALRSIGLLTALVITFGAIGLIELPAALTRYGLQMAASPSPQTRARGIRFLRSYGSKDHLLRSCYDQSRRTIGIFGALLSRDYVDVNEARRIYYRVTGETFDMSVPSRRVADASISQSGYYQGSTRMGGDVNALSLAESKLEGTIDSDGGLAYLQWTLTFENDSHWGKEARAEIQLPPGGVVTSMTLSDRGEEVEAEFGNRVRIGQESQVLYTRDPVLVTTAGRDRILIQRFPVSPFAEESKIRLGIAVPLVLESRSQVRLLLPHFEARNFRIPYHVNHKIWFESERPIATEFGGLYYGQMPDNDFMLGGQITDDDLSNPERSLLISRLDRDTGTWSHNPFEVEGSIVKQWIEERTPVHLRRIVLVVDTSASMADWEPEINAALAVLPRDTDLKLVLADAEWLHETEFTAPVGDGVDQASLLLASATFAGGADNAPALQKAWDLAAAAPGNNAIVWIHDPQPVKLDSVETVRKRWQVRPYGPLLYSVQTSKGSDEIVKRLDGINEVKSVIRMGTLRADLERLFKQLSGQTKTLEFVRSVKHAELPEETEGYKTSDVLAKLWANDEVVRLLNARDESLNETASKLAKRYQLVTSVSDAAVRDSTREVARIDTAPVTHMFTHMGETEVETLMLGAVLLTIALVCMKFYGTTGPGGFPRY
ncbi:MAG TPA: hypothetical protein VF290_16445 [Pyrinomonadaceae bacterium]